MNTGSSSSPYESYLPLQTTNLKRSSYDLGTDSKNAKPPKIAGKKSGPNSKLVIIIATTAAIGLLVVAVIAIVLVVIWKKPKPASSSSSTSSSSGVLADNLTALPENPVEYIDINQPEQEELPAPRRVQFDNDQGEGEDIYTVYDKMGATYPNKSPGSRTRSRRMDWRNPEDDYFENAEDSPVKVREFKAMGEME